MVNQTLKADGTGGYSEHVAAHAELATMANYFYIHTTSPEGVIAAPLGSICINTAGGANTAVFVKETGTTTSSGWVGVGA